MTRRQKRKYRKAIRDLSQSYFNSEGQLIINNERYVEGEYMAAFTNKEIMTTVNYIQEKNKMEDGN